MGWMGEWIFELQMGEMKLPPPCLATALATSTPESWWPILRDLEFANVEGNLNAQASKSNGLFSWETWDSSRTLSTLFIMVSKLNYNGIAVVQFATR